MMDPHAAQLHSKVCGAGSVGHTDGVTVKIARSGTNGLIKRDLNRLCVLLALAALVALMAGTTPVHAQSNNPARAPSNLTAEADSCGVNLAWDAPTEDAGSVTGYNLLRTPAGGSTTTLDTGAASSTDTAYADTNAARAESHTYRVRALRGDVASDDSNEVEVAFPAAPTPTAVDVAAVPIVVTSTTSDYFVLYAKHDVEKRNELTTTVEYPVLVALGEAARPRSPRTLRRSRRSATGWRNTKSPTPPTWTATA